MKREVVKKVLSNGVTAYLYADANLKRMIAAYTAKYGTLGYYDQFYYEDKLFKVPPAVAHFIEHTLVETSKYGNILHRFKERSYEINAMTGREFTTYYFVGIKDTWKSLEELINMVDDVNYDEESIKKVANAIVEEANKCMDQKYSLGFNANKRNATAAYSAVHETYSILGTGETTRSITKEDIDACYGAYYADDNKFLVIGGNFDIDEMVEFLEGVYAKLPRHPSKMRPFDYGDLLPIRKAYEELEKPVSNDYVYVTYKMRNECKEDLLIVDLYLSMFMRMKFGGDTKFVTELSNDKVISGGVSHTADFFKGMIAVTFQADVFDQEEFLRRIDSQLNTDELDEKFFELIKKSYKVTELSKMDNIYKALLGFPRNIDFTEKLYMMDVLDELTIEGMKQLIDRLDWSLKTVTVIKKEQKEKAD